METKPPEKNSKENYHSPKFYEYGDIRSLTEGVGDVGVQDGQTGYGSDMMSYGDLKTRT
jgi:hypothetical protein